MITFKSINNKRDIREWKFNSAKELEDIWRGNNSDLPDSEDPITDVVIDGKEIYVGPTMGSGDPEDEDTAWFEDLLTYLGIDIW